MMFMILFKYIYIYKLFFLYFLKFQKLNYIFKKRLLKKKFFYANAVTFNLTNFFFFKKVTYLFFKKRYFLIKYWRNLKRKIFKTFLKNFYKFFILNLFFFKNLTTKFPKFHNFKHKYLSIFLNNIIKKNFFKKKYLHKYFYHIFLKKFNTLKKYFRSNISDISLFNIKKKNFKKFFKFFVKCNNINFFYIYFYQLKHLIFKTTFFFNWFTLIYFINNYGVYINGTLCQNNSFFINPNSIYTIQLNWSWFYYYYYVSWYKYYKIQKKRISHINWLFFFRKYIQKKNYKTYPKWLYVNKTFKWLVPFFLEVSMFILTFFILPFFFN